MKIQSLSVVPNVRCINSCAFCVAETHPNLYKNQMDDNIPFFDLNFKDYIKRLEFARHNGCNTVMLTGNSEPQQNWKFLTPFTAVMRVRPPPLASPPSLLLSPKGLCSWENSKRTDTQERRNRNDFTRNPA